VKDAKGASELSFSGRMQVIGGGSFIRALAATWRYRAIGEESVRKLRADRRAILFTLWHGEMLPLLWYHRNQGVAVLVSEHKDGELIAQILEWMGYATIRGSTNRGAGRALIGLVRTLREGRDAAVTPDGPRGPRHKFAPGAVVAAHRSGAPILPTVAVVDRYWQLKTWDGFIIPKPFARITVCYGDATSVEGDTPREAASEAPHLERAMHDAREKVSA
jgi:lysophospholipid acyltransferase (LPLAT)-like uncharacterized protein